MSPERRWPLGLALVLALTIAGNVLVYVIANQRDAMAVEPDYYRKAVAWDSTLAERDRSAALGWTAHASLGPPAPHAALLLDLRDASGAAIAGARVSADGYAVAHGSETVVAPMPEQAPGRYAVALVVPRAEWYEIRVVAERGTDRFVAQLRCFPGRDCVTP